MAVRVPASTSTTLLRTWKSTLAQQKARENEIVSPSPKLSKSQMHSSAFEARLQAKWWRGLIKAEPRCRGLAEIDGYVTANNSGTLRVVNIMSLVWSKAVSESPVKRWGGWEWGGRVGEGFLGGNSKSFMGKGGEEIASWTLRVSNYFYCPHSPSFSVQSGVLGSSKKHSRCHSFPKEMSRQVRTNNRLFCHLDYCAW